MRFIPVTLPPFQAFLDDHRADVHRFLLAAVGREEADDCLQETFLAALRAYPKLSDARNLRAWALTIAHRKAIDAHRARSRRPVPTEPVAGVGAGPSGAADGSARPAINEPDPGGLGGPTDGDPALWALVRRLPPKQRSAVVLRFVLDLSYDGIAEVAGGSAVAARRNVHEGLAKLRREWSS